MLIVTPPTSISTRAVKIETGMLTAATSVERRLNRNRKMTMTAKTAPRPPSRSSPSRDWVMKVDRSETVVIESWSPYCAWSSLNWAFTASATSTVFAPEVLETEIVRAGWPFVRA